MPVSTYFVVVKLRNGQTRRLTVVSDSPQGARVKAAERRKDWPDPGQIVKVIRLHTGPPKEGIARRRAGLGST